MFVMEGRNMWRTCVGLFVAQRRSGLGCTRVYLGEVAEGNQNRCRSLGCVLNGPVEGGFEDVGNEVV